MIVCVTDNGLLTFLWKMVGAEGCEGRRRNVCNFAEEWWPFTHFYNMDIGRDKRRTRADLTSYTSIA